jgi:hypothetical protein
VGLTAAAIRAHTKSTFAAVGANGMFGLFLMLKAMLAFG